MAAINTLLTKRQQDGVLIATHRGMVVGNIPHNTFAAFNAALLQGTDIIETDVTPCADGTVFIFHPKQELKQLGLDVDIQTMSSAQVRKLRYLNDCRAATECGLHTLDEFLEEYKNRCLINLDHAWKTLPPVMEAVRRHKMEDQILMKAPAQEEFLLEMQALAPDLMFMPIFKEDDSMNERIEQMNLNYVAAELVFAEDSSPLVSEKAIEEHHKKGRLLWCNAILYNYKKPLSGGHTDDRAVTGDPDGGWGWIADRGFDIIQTDWTMPLRAYLDKR